MNTKEEKNQRAAQGQNVRKVVKIFMEGGVIQDYEVPEGVELFVQDQDEIECGEDGTWTIDGGPDAGRGSI